MSLGGAEAPCPLASDRDTLFLVLEAADPRLFDTFEEAALEDSDPHISALRSGVTSARSFGYTN